MWKALPTMTISINGAIRATNVGNIQHRPATSLTTPWVMRIWTKTASGTPILSTARSGIPAMWPATGLRTATDTGYGFRHGVGRGSMTLLGVLRHFTMAVG